jgi:hypothetical protein
MLKEEVKAKVYQAMGQVSMCWEPIPTGQFKSVEAVKIIENLLQTLYPHINEERTPAISEKPEIFSTEEKYTPYRGPMYTA